MENQNQGSVPSQPLDSPCHELQSPQKRNRRESPQNESSVSAQSLKRSRNAALFPPPFPQEIIVEILSNLPVKSLLRFRCVSKSWKAIVKDPLFVKKHLKNPKNSKKRVLLKTASEENDQCSFKSCSVTAVFQDPIIHLKEIEYPLKDDSHGDVIVGSCMIVGSCNGLICIATGQDKVFLINPILRAFKFLPDLGFRRKEDCCTLFGFGFDASRDDYKVVSLFCDLSKGFECSSETTVRIYSLKTNNWRRIQDFPFGDPCLGSGKFVDGCLIWSVFRKQDMGSMCTIVSLDLAHETYKEVVQPCYGVDVKSVTIGVLDGCLCVLCNTMGLDAEVWVMKEYGKNESWSKLVDIPYTLFPEYGLFSAPIFVSVIGEILLDFESDLIIYDPKEKACRKPVIDNANVSCIEQVVYEESLVSPNAVNQHG